MGNRGSNNNNNQNNNGVDPLTANPDAYRNIYGNTSDIPLYPGAYAMGDLGAMGSRQPKLEVKKTVPIQNDFFVDKNTIALIRTNEIGKFYLKFTFSSKTDVTITIYYCGRDICDNNNNTEYVFEDENFPVVKSFIFAAGANQEFPINASIVDSKIFLTDYMTSHTVDRFPLIIKMETKSDNPTEVRKIFYIYVTFSLSKDGFTGKVLKQKLEINKRSFVLDDVFGISSSGLKDYNAVDSKECAICLTSRIDTVVLPCKHMCLCFECAQNLRNKSNNKCPLCRNVVESFMKLENTQNPTTQ